MFFFEKPLFDIPQLSDLIRVTEPFVPISQTDNFTLQTGQVLLVMYVNPTTEQIAVNTENYAWKRSKWIERVDFDKVTRHVHPVIE